MSERGGMDGCDCQALRRRKKKKKLSMMMRRRRKKKKKKKKRKLWARRLQGPGPAAVGQVVIIAVAEAAERSAVQQAAWLVLQIGSNPL